MILELFGWRVFKMRIGRSIWLDLILKKNCKIGSHSVIMPGVTIGENAIIGAFSFVNRNVPDNVVAASVPVKVIKKIEGE
jgi:acetyltransferase-like isoleucine patch superfamily enzyme